MSSPHGRGVAGERASRDHIGSDLAPVGVSVSTVGEALPSTQYRRAVQRVSCAARRVASSHAVDFRELIAVADELTASLAENDTLVEHVLAGTPADDRLAANCVNVAILATKLGKGCGLGARALARLTRAALVHDVGMFTVPEGVVDKSAPLSAEERSFIHDHPAQGARLLAQTGEADRDLIEIVAQEHERWNGQGYPQHLAGGRIHPFARLIGLADVLDALINPRPYHARMTPSQAVHHVLTQQQDAFPHEARKALLEQITLYPLGTQVRLNTGRRGTVVRLNPRAPLRPIVRVNTDAERMAVPHRLVDLSVATAWHIVEVLANDSSQVGEP